MKGVRFDADTHTYTNEATGLPLVGVTTAIRAAGLMDDRFWTTEARDRGTLVHQTCALIDEGVLDWTSLDPALEGYARAWEGFLAQTEGLLLWETVVADLERGYAGTLDCVAMLRGDKTPWLIDVKTNHAAPWTALQTAAYARPVRTLLNEPRLKRGVVVLTDGRAQLTEYTERGDEKLFLHLVEIAQWKASHS